GVALAGAWRGGGGGGVDPVSLGAETAAAPLALALAGRDCNTDLVAAGFDRAHFCLARISGVWRSLRLAGERRGAFALALYIGAGVSARRRAQRGAGVFRSRETGSAGLP